MAEVEPSGCQYQGGGLRYVDGDPKKGKMHILERHKRHATPQVPRNQAQGLFLSDSWSDIWGVIEDANDNKDGTGVSWKVEGSLCVVRYEFHSEIGSDDPPEAGSSRPPGATGGPTHCLPIVIVNEAAPAEVITSYPIAC